MESLEKRVKARTVHVTRLMPWRSWRAVEGRFAAF